MDFALSLATVLPPVPDSNQDKVHQKGIVMETLASARLNCQHLLDKPRAYVDLNAGWPRESHYVVPLSSRATEGDLQLLGHSLTPGLLVDFWTDDGDGEGHPDPLLFRGRIEFNEDVQKWVAVAGLDGFRHASEQEGIKQEAEPALVA